MPPFIENPADCKIRSIIRYLSGKGVKTVEIRRNISEVYHNELLKMAERMFMTRNEASDNQ